MTIVQHCSILTAKQSDNVLIFYDTLKYAKMLSLPGQMEFLYTIFGGNVTGENFVMFQLISPSSAIIEEGYN